MQYNYLPTSQINATNYSDHRIFVCTGCMPDFSLHGFVEDSVQNLFTRTNVSWTNVIWINVEDGCLKRYLFPISTQNTHTHTHTDADI